MSLNTQKLQRVSQFLFRAILIFLAIWLSFFAEPIQSKCVHVLIIIFFAALTFIIFANLAIAKAIFLDKTDIFLWAYIAMVTASVFFAQNRQRALDTYILYAIPIALLYFLFKIGFFLLKRKDWFFLIISSVAGLVALYALLEYVFRRNPLYEHFVKNIYYKYYLFQHRAMATQLVPQALGTYLAACMPAVYYFIFRSGNIRRRALWLAWSILLFIGIIVSAQRVAVVSFLISSFFYFVMKNRKALLGFCLLISVFLFVSYFVRTGPLRRVGIKGLTSETPYCYRMGRIITTMKMVKDYPWFGIGLNHYKLMFDKYEKNRTGYFFKTPENMYLAILCETGVFSFVFFILFISLLLKKAFIHVKLKLVNHEIALALVSGAIAILVSMLTYEALHWAAPFCMFWIYCGMLASLVNVKQNV